MCLSGCSGRGMSVLISKRKSINSRHTRDIYRWLSNTTLVMFLCFEEVIINSCKPMSMGIWTYKCHKAHGQSHLWLWCMYMCLSLSLCKYGWVWVGVCVYGFEFDIVCVWVCVVAKSNSCTHLKLDTYQTRVSLRKKYKLEICVCVCVFKAGFVQGSVRYV